MTPADRRYWAPVAESLRREECAKIIRTAPWTKASPMVNKKRATPRRVARLGERMGTA